MRTALCAHLDASGGEGLSAFVLEAMQTHRDQFEPLARPA
jgi:formate dehydrogenase subunit delta